MRLFSLLFLLLIAARPGAHFPGQAGGELPGSPGGHWRHSMPSMWHMGPHNGTARSDFGRMLHREYATGVPHSAHRLNGVEIGHGGYLGVGFVQGHHLGLRFGRAF